MIQGPISGPVKSPEEKREETKMKWLNRIFSFFLIGFAVYIYYSCVGLGLGKPQAPGPGLMPALAAALLFVLALSTFIIEMKGSHGREEKSSLAWQDLARPLILLISLIGYAFLLDILGYLVATFLLLFILFSLTEPQKWRKELVIAAIVSTSSYLIFNKGLHVPLPAGLFFVGW
jgi:putative tricarboxylic transport membrane protein